MTSFEDLQNELALAALESRSGMSTSQPNASEQYKSYLRNSEYREPTHEEWAQEIATLTAERDALKNERDAQQRVLDMEVSYSEKLNQDILKLKEWVQELEQDAKRYRFLRDFPRRKDYYTEEANWNVAREQHGMGQVYRSHELDAAIDAAMKDVPIDGFGGNLDSAFDKVQP